MDATYNDIAQWKFKDLVDVFGADPEKSKTFQVKTKQEAEDLFNDKEFSSAPYLQVFQVPRTTIHRISILIQTVRGALHAEGGCSEGPQIDR